MIDALVSSDEHKAHKTFQDFVGVVGDIPAALFGSVECPPEGEADLNYHRWGLDRHLLVNHDNPSTCSRLSFVELVRSKDDALKQIRSVYPGLKWDKGLSAINTGNWSKRWNVKISSLPYQFLLLWAGQEMMSTETTAIRAAPGFIHRI